MARLRRQSRSAAQERLFKVETRSYPRWSPSIARTPARAGWHTRRVLHLRRCQRARLQARPGRGGDGGRYAHRHQQSSIRFAVVPPGPVRRQPVGARPLRLQYRRLTPADSRLAVRERPHAGCVQVPATTENEGKRRREPVAPFLAPIDFRHRPRSPTAPPPDDVAAGSSRRLCPARLSIAVISQTQPSLCPLHPSTLHPSVPFDRPPACIYAQPIVYSTHG